MESLEKAVERNPHEAVFTFFLAHRYQEMDGAEEQRSRSLREQVADLAPDSFIAEAALFSAAMSSGDIRGGYHYINGQVAAEQ